MKKFYNKATFAIAYFDATEVVLASNYYTTGADFEGDFATVPDNW